MQGKKIGNYASKGEANMRDDTDVSRRTALGLVGSGLAGGGPVETVAGAPGLRGGAAETGL